MIRLPVWIALLAVLLSCGSSERRGDAGQATRGSEVRVAGLSGAELHSAATLNRRIRQSRDYGAGPGAPVSAGACGDPRIMGEQLAPIVEAGTPCGITAPVRISRISGIAVEGSPVLSCAFAQAAADWADAVLPQAEAQHGRRVVSITTIGDYSCRSRNGVRGARISNHAFGNALDIAGFTFADGSRASLDRDWNGAAHGPFLRRLFDLSCPVFNTALGPRYNAAHRDHFHFDISPQFSGQRFCR